MGKRKISIWRIIAGCVFLGGFLYLQFGAAGNFEGDTQVLLQTLGIVLLGCALAFGLPIRKRDTAEAKVKRPLTTKTIVALLFIMLLIPVTVIFGMFVLKNGKYYFVSLLVIIEAIAAFMLAFEGRKPQAKELIIISVLCAIAVGGRIVLAGVPMFKPIIAIIVISGVAFGAETGFLVGSVSAFVSNFYFGQSAFTPCQMLAWGLIGFIGGLMFKGSRLRTSPIVLAIFGFFAVLVIHGGITNTVSAMMFYPSLTPKRIISSMVLGLPYDLMFATSTAFFLYFLAPPIGEKLDRIKIKYGI